MFDKRMFIKEREKELVIRICFFKVEQIWTTRSIWMDSTKKEIATLISSKVAQITSLYFLDIC